MKKLLYKLESMKTALIFLIVFFPPAFSEGKKTAFKLDPRLKEAYLALLEQAGDFHKALDKGSAPAIQKKIKDIQEIIAKLYKQISSVPQFHHKIHSYKLLKSIEEQMAVIHFNSRLDKRKERKNIKKLFNSFFELAQVYNLTKDIKDKVFYCSRDKSLWFQKSGLAKNPVSSSHKNCGRLIL